LQKADNRRQAVFFVRSTVASLLRAAVVGMPSGMPVSFCTGSPTLPFAAHPFGDGGSFNAAKGGLHAWHQSAKENSRT